jgi:bifunctional DNA-binding transcriptional regulator/antitoxin component of YhaV-PrlF toxin-antitoxin module
MKIAIDSVGRLVVPKALRAELGITGPTELDVAVRDGDPVIVTDEPMKPLTVESVRAAIDRVRR